MQKLTIKHKLYLLKHARRLHLRAIAHRQWKKEKRKGPHGQYVLAHSEGRDIRARALSSIKMPKVLCLDTNTDETLRFLHGIRGQILQKAPKRSLTRRGKTELPIIRNYLDFTTMEYIGPSAALILAALFQRAKNANGYKLSTIDEYRWNASVRAVLSALGFHELLDMRPLTNWGFDSDRFKILKFQSGREAAGEPAGKLQEALGELLPDKLKEGLLTAQPYGGMFEAILNSNNWAYPEEHAWDFPVLPNWWITGAVATTTNAVTVCAFDQGITIPVSLPRWTHWGPLELRGRRIVERLRLSRPIDDPANDGIAIRLAMKIARTSSYLPQHGKGLNTMIEVAQRARHGRLRILSRNGEYIWETGKKPQSRNHEHPLNGTLVEWQLQL